MSLVDSVRKLIVPIHKEGYVFIAIGAVATLVLGQLWAPFGWLGTLITLWICYFFRDPVRIVPQREGLVVSPADGRVSHALSGLALDPADLRLAIVEAGGGRIGSVVDRVRLLCYGFDPSHGFYNLAIGRALSIGGGVTVALLAGFLGFMFRRERRAH